MLVEPVDCFQLSYFFNFHHVCFIGNQGDKWIKTKVSIGRRYEPFFLNFTATVGGGVRGDIAIDEISFENCGHPPLCTGNDPGKFM